MVELPPLSVYCQMTSINVISRPLQENVAESPTYREYEVVLGIKDAAESYF